MDEHRKKAAHDLAQWCRERREMDQDILQRLEKGTLSVASAKLGTPHNESEAWAQMLRTNIAKMDTLVAQYEAPDA